MSLRHPVILLCAGIQDSGLHIALSALLGSIPLVLFISEFIPWFGVSTHDLRS